MDSSLFIFRSSLGTAYLLLYVDDITLTASSASLLQRIITALSSEFSMKDMGPLHHFLGVQVHRSGYTMLLHQEKYATDLLDCAGMTSCKPCSTPVDTSSKLSAAVGAAVADPTAYRSMAGALQYLTFTRSDIAYAVQQICLHMHDPCEGHLNLVKRVLCYIKGTLRHDILLSASLPHKFTAYSDAN